MSIHSTGLSDLEFALVVNPRTACLMLSCSHKRLYQLMVDGELESFKNGRARKDHCGIDQRAHRSRPSRFRGVKAQASGLAGDAQLTFPTD